MSKKTLRMVCIIQGIIIAIGVFVAVRSTMTANKFQNADLVEYLNQFSEENNYLPDAGYIPDAKTAKLVGSAIIDGMTGEKWFGETTVKYDAENRLWRVDKGYLFHRGGFVVIEQDSGKVIKALFVK